MPDFDPIRPYEDAEVPSVVARLRANKALRRGVAALAFPRLHARWPTAAETLAGLVLRWRSRGIRTVLDFQLLTGRYLGLVLRTRTTAVTFSGLEQLAPDRPCLFLSNHRDIVLDSGLINLLLHSAGHGTCRLAVGDNLFSTEYAADIMRLNKSFMVERSVSGRKAQYQALQRTSAYVRHSIEEGQHLWIAQRGGRTKDGLDRTDPALLKMLALAFRREAQDLYAVAQTLNLVPVSISYELDPCDLRKVEELTALAEHGQFEKGENDDLAAIVEGLIGFKGRVHVHFGTLPEPEDESAEALALAIDRAIVGQLKLYPTHASAAERQGLDVPQDIEVDDGRSVPVLEARLEGLTAQARGLLLDQYANLVRNRAALGIQETPSQPGMPLKL